MALTWRSPILGNTGRIWSSAIAVCLLSVTHPLPAENGLPDSLSVCEGCHGEGGVSTNPMVPILAGQPFTFIEDNLLAFRAGARSCSPQRLDSSAAGMLASTMCSQVQALTDAEISALAGYFERQQFEPAQQPFDQSQVARGRGIHDERGCEQCHSDGGETTNAMAPVLAGQWTPYLQRAMGALRAGTRKGPVEMTRGIGTLTDAEVDALLAFYASRQRQGSG
ncbi:MAG TPA: c-type cytochrome [Gammaproteobacteria bacterium]|nr:c-type cytochrome [Gammaproteobacteria bacterium]